jgi:hypothetical protein
MRWALACVLLVSCAPPPRDLLLGPAYSDEIPETTTLEAPRPPGTTTTTGSAVASRRVLAESGTPALAIDGARVYYGSAAEDSLLARPKKGGNPTVVGQPAPVAISAGDGALAWIGHPGDTVLRVTRVGDAPTKIGDGGIFTAIAVNRGDVFVTEAADEHGLLKKLTGVNAGLVAELDAAPRSLAVDDDSLFVLSASTVSVIPRAGGKPRSLGTARDLAHAALDREFVYATAALGTSRAVMRVAKHGGDLTAVQLGVRNAPFAIFEGNLYYLDATEPAIRRVSSSGGSSTVVASDVALAQVNALAVDASGIYVGCEHIVLAFSLRR